MLLDSLRGAQQLLAAPRNALTGALTPAQMKAKAAEYALSLFGLSSGAGTMLERGLGNAFGSFKGYHGSPHTFDQFENKAIGTGQGAASYGYGHYVAGVRDTAEDYAKSLTKPTFFMGEKELPKDNFYYNWLHPLMTESDDLEDAIKIAKSSHQDNLNARQQVIANGGRPSDIESWDEQVRQSQLAIDTITHPDFKAKRGNLYHLEVEPDEHQLLSWDDKLADMHPEVRAKVRPIIQSTINRLIANNEQRIQHLGMPKFDARKLNPEEMTGAEIYHELARDLGEQRLASETLSGVGIPGMRYLDQFSRGRVGTSNDLRLTKYGEDEYGLRAYGHPQDANRESIKFTIDDVHDKLTAQKLKEFIGEEAATALLKQVEGAGRGAKAYHGGPVHFKGTSNYVVFDPKHIKINKREGK
jgi:hypothetical protein